MTTSIGCPLIGWYGAVNRWRFFAGSGYNASCTVLSEIVMNKAELIDAIALKAGMTKKQANTALDSFLEVVIDTVAKGDKVTLVGFGTFEQRHRQGREGRNPSTGERIAIPATTVPGFSAGKLFKEKVA